MRLSPARLNVSPRRWGTPPAFERLDPGSAAPLCVAVSGGGDSLAALIHTCAWAKTAGRKVLALSVDHGLQSASAAWTVSAGEAAHALGADFRALTWSGPKPATGLAAAARAARHRLLAQAAREAGARVIVTGHTAGDQDENAALGQGRLTDWSPSPVWPQGRGLFLLRPLLDERREDLRSALAAEGWTWIDDPANDDLGSRRIQVRRGLAGRVGRRNPSSSHAPLARGPLLLPLGEGMDVGALRLSRSIDRYALSAALVCAGGGERTPRGDALDRLMARIEAGEHFVACLVGARLQAAADLVFTREPGRAGLERRGLPVGEAVVWDGRFELIAQVPGLSVRALGGAKRRLPAGEQDALRALPPAARPVLPLIEITDRTVTCPHLAQNSLVQARALVMERFAAATGAITCEREAL